MRVDGAIVQSCAVSTVQIGSTVGLVALQQRRVLAQRQFAQVATCPVTASRPVGGTRFRECPELVFYPSKRPLSPQLVLSSNTIRRRWSGGRPYALVMALVITIPDDAARRLAEAATGRGVTPEELARDLLTSVPVASATA